jgi:hypothetical protein
MKEANLHFGAAMKLVDMMGGISKMPDAESGLLIHALIGLAMMSRSRPLVHPDDFDPGPWCEQEFAYVLPELSSPSGKTPTATIRPHRSSHASPTQRTIFAEMRELLQVEEYKLTHARDHSDQAEKVFRWAHFRKLAVRAWAMNSYCDLLEFQSSLPAITPPFETSPPSVAAAQAPQETFDTCMVHATRLFDRIIFEEQYSPQGPFPLSRGNYSALLAGLTAVQARSSRTELAVWKADILWMASAGAYFEDTFLQQRFKNNVGVGSITSHFSSGIPDLMKELGLGDLDDVKTFLTEQYLYCPRLQDATMNKLVPRLDEPIKSAGIANREKATSSVPMIRVSEYEEQAN